MSRQLVCLALLALAATAAAALPKYSCSGKITAADGKKYAFVEWTATLTNSAGKKAGTVKICWNRQGIKYPPTSNTTTGNVTSIPEFQWSASLTNVEAYKSVVLGNPANNATIPVGILDGPPATLLKKADFFGTVPTSLLSNPALQAFFAAGCTISGKDSQAQAWLVTLGATGLPVPGTKVFFKVSKGGSCVPNIYP